MEKIGVIILLTVILIFSGCTESNDSGETTPTATPTQTPITTPTSIPQPTLTPTATTTPEENQIWDDERAESLGLEIRLEKTTYEVGEEILGEYYVKYNGEPFKAKILYCRSREEIEEEYCTLISGQLDDIDFDDPDKINMLEDGLTAFILDIDPNNQVMHQSSSAPFFQSPANYS